MDDLIHFSIEPGKTGSCCHWCCNYFTHSKSSVFLFLSFLFFFFFFHFPYNEFLRARSWRMPTVFYSCRRVWESRVEFRMWCTSTLKRPHDSIHIKIHPLSLLVWLLLRCRLDTLAWIHHLLIFIINDRKKKYICMCSYQRFLFDNNC